MAQGPPLRSELRDRRQFAGRLPRHQLSSPQEHDCQRRRHKWRPPHKVNEELKKFFGQLQKRMSDLAAQDQARPEQVQRGTRQIAEVAGWAHGEWVRIHPLPTVADGPPGSSRIGCRPVSDCFQSLVFAQDRNNTLWTGSCCLHAGRPQQDYAVHRGPARRPAELGVLSQQPLPELLL